MQEQDKSMLRWIHQYSPHSSMRHSIPALTIILSLALVGCSGNERTSLKAENKNPLTAQRYGEELADTLANLIIQKDKKAEDPKNAEIIRREIENAKDIAADAEKRMEGGTKGPFLQMQSLVEGYALYQENRLYFSSDFVTKPGLDLHVYLSEAVDPRDVEFPDASAIDLGSLQRIDGAQIYDVPRTSEPGKYLSVVLWEKTLGILYAFAQIR